VTVKRLRVAHVSFHADPQRRDAAALLEAWPTLSGVASGVSRAGVDVVVVQTAHTDQAVEREGITYSFVDDRRRMPTRLIARVQSMRPDVLHVHGFHHAASVWQLARALPGVPLMIQDHGSLPPMGWRRGAYRWALGAVAGAAFTHGDQALPWKSAGILRDAVPVFEILEGSTSFTPGDQTEARRVTGMSGDPCVLWTGRLNANKDPLTMLSAFEHAARTLPDARLWCCFGDASMLDSVQQRIARSDVLRERVTLLGARPHHEMEHRYRSADIYVQTSHREGSGYSLIESLACGTTPVVTDIPAARKIAGTVGALTPVGDGSSMGRAIIHCAQQNRARLRRDARARFDAALTFDSIGVALRASYERLAACAS
jgi:glycosyltransferase involved in cell wall biosynthesis